MAITVDHVGRQYPATEPYRITVAKIKEFAEALGDSSDAAVTGDGVVAAPPTFAMVIAARAWQALFDDAELGLALRRTIHGDQQFRWERPLRDGDEVTAQLRIDKVRTRGSNDIVTVAVDLATTEGEALCTATSTLFHTRDEVAA